MSGRPSTLAHRLICGVTAMTLALVAGVLPVRGEYPEKPVRVVIPYGPGGVADVTVRLVAQKLSERLGKQFIIDNRPGAGGITAAVSVLSSPRDGYTLFLTGNGPAISVSLFKSLPYDLVRDFTPISMMAKFDVMLATQAGSDLDSVAKIVAHARSNPGKLNFGTIAPGTTQHLSAELFKLMTGIDATVVTYRSSPEIVTALLRGDIDVAFDYLVVFQPTMSDQKIKIVAAAGEVPAPQLPGVPTVRSSGYPDYVAISWNGLVAPTGTSPEIVAKLNTEMNAVLKMPEIRAQIDKLGMEAVAGTPEDLGERTRADIRRWGQVIEKIGLPKQ